MSTAASPASIAPPAYDRELIARMLDEHGEAALNKGGSNFSVHSITEQARLLREADNAEAASIRTVSVAGDAGELPEKALRDALQYVGQRTDGDALTLAKRCELWMRESKELFDLQRRLATAEQPGSAVQGEAVSQAVGMLCETMALLRYDGGLRDGDFANRIESAVNLLKGTTPPPAPAADHIVDANKMVAPAAEQGDAVTKALDTLTQYSAEHGHPADFERAITTLSVLAKSTATQPAARGVEGMVPAISPNGSDDDMLAYLDKLLTVQGQLMFAREDYDEEAAETFGVAILDFMRLYGMRLRAKLAPAPEPVRVDGALALRLLDWQPLACNNRGDRLWQLLESAGLPHDQQIAALTAALAGKERA